MIAQHKFQSTRAPVIIDWPRRLVHSRNLDGEALIGKRWLRRSGIKAIFSLIDSGKLNQHDANGMFHSLDCGRWIIGRTHQCKFNLDGEFLSRLHDFGRSASRWMDTTPF